MPRRPHEDAGLLPAGACVAARPVPPPSSFSHALALERNPPRTARDLSRTSADRKAHADTSLAAHTPHVGSRNIETKARCDRKRRSLEPELRDEISRKKRKGAKSLCGTTAEVGKKSSRTDSTKRLSLFRFLSLLSAHSGIRVEGGGTGRAAASSAAQSGARNHRGCVRSGRPLNAGWFCRSATKPTIDGRF